jgi:hypothetical protein
MPIESMPIQPLGLGAPLALRGTMLAAAEVASAAWAAGGVLLEPG